MDRIIRIKELQHLTGGLSRTTVWRLCKDKDADFPKPVKIGRRAVGFSAQAVEKWIASRFAGDANAEPISDQAAAQPISASVSSSNKKTTTVK